MKQFSLFFILLLAVLIMLSACSTDPSLELVSAKADIVNDKSKTGSTILQEGDKAGKEVVLTSLYYMFSIKNSGNEKVGNIKKGKVLKARIEPHEKLITASKEALGFSIFDTEDEEGTGLGNGHSFVSILEGNETGEFIFYYDLGVEEETAEVHHVPPKEQLNQLHKNALGTTLIISLGKEEIARFDLSNKD